MTPEYGQAQRRILQIVCAFAGRELDGLAPSEIQRALGIKSASSVTRDLAVLKDMGLAEQIQETGRWRLGPRFIQMALDFQLGMSKAVSKVEELQQRYTRTP